MDIPEFNYASSFCTILCLPLGDDPYHKVSQYKELKFIVKCDSPVVITYRWSYDGNTSTVEQRYQLVPGRWECIKLDVITNYLNIEANLASGFHVPLFIYCRAILLDTNLYRKEPDPLDNHSELPAQPKEVPVSPCLELPSGEAPSPPVEVIPAVHDKPFNHKKRFFNLGKRNSTPPESLKDDRLPGLITRGSMIYGGGSNFFRLLPLGAEGDILVINNGLPTWMSPHLLNM